MSQGVTVKGKTTGDQNVAVLVDEQGRLYLNPDSVPTFSGGGTALAEYQLVQDDENATYEYYGYVKSDGSWCIKRVTISTNYSEFVIGASAYATAWTNRASQTYDDYWDVF